MKEVAQPDALSQPAYADSAAGANRCGSCSLNMLELYRILVWPSSAEVHVVLQQQVQLEVLWFQFQEAP